MKNAGTCSTPEVTRSQEEVVDEAERLPPDSNEFGDLDLQQSNCKHSAVFRKTGRRQSEQMDFGDQFGLPEVPVGCGTCEEGNEE